MRKTILILCLSGKAYQILKVFKLYCEQHGNKTLAEIAEKRELELSNMQETDAQSFQGG